MPLAGTHIVITIAVLAAVRKFLKIKFSNRLLLLGGLIGLLPDIDMPLALAINRIFGTSVYFHKIYTHALLIPLVLYLTALTVKKFNVKAATAILIAAVAWLVHVILDCYFILPISQGRTRNLLPFCQTPRILFLKACSKRRKTYSEGLRPFLPCRF